MACSSNSSKQSQRGDTNTSPSTQNTLDTEPVADTNTTVAQSDLLGIEWTLETVRGNAGEYRPLPLATTWSLTFYATGDVEGQALCNHGSGNWQTDDSTLSIYRWLEEEASCESKQKIPTATQTILNRFLAGETVMPRVETGRLFIDTGDGAQLVFSGRAKNKDEQTISSQTLVQTTGGTRASNGDPIFGDLSPPYVIYRDAKSLETDYATLPVEETSWPALPGIDFTSSIVVGVYLPLDGSISSDVVVRGARVSSYGLEIEIARFSPNVPDDASINCAADTALSAPWTLVIIDSVVEPIQFSEMARAFCSGIPASDTL